MPITLDGTLGVGTPGITLAGGAITASANQLNSSAEDVNAENRIINGDMSIWQRGASSTSLGYVAADRWINNITGGTVTQARVAVNPGDQIGGNNLAFYLSQSVSGQTLPSHLAATTQNIEGVRSYAGQTITVLGWAVKSGGGAGNMAVEGTQVFGTGGVGVSDPVYSISPTTVPLSSGTWTPFAVVMNVPSIAGKTLGTDGRDFFAVNFWTSAGSNFNARTNSLGLQTITVNLWGIHIRVGTWTAADAALYRPRDPGTELALCQRFFEVRTGCRIIAQAGSAGQAMGMPLDWNMRATPQSVVTWGTLVNVNSGTSAIATTSRTTGFTFITSTASGNVDAQFSYTIDAEL